MTRLMLALKGRIFDDIITMHQLEAELARLKTQDICRRLQQCQNHWTLTMGVLQYGQHGIKVTISYHRGKQI
jgi:hypothetical protein